MRFILNPKPMSNSSVLLMLILLGYGGQIAIFLFRSGRILKRFKQIQTNSTGVLDRVKRYLSPYFLRPVLAMAIDVTVSFFVGSLIGGLAPGQIGAVVGGLSCLGISILLWYHLDRDPAPQALTLAR